MARSTLKELIAAAPRVAREFASLKAAEEYNAGIKALNDEAKENWGNSVWHREQAALLAESLDYGFQNENVFSTYFPSQTVGEFEKVTIREKRGLKVYYTHRAGEIDESVMRDDVWELPRDTMGWHVSEYEDDVRANYGQTIADLIPYAKQREEAEVNRRIFQLAQEAVPAGSASYEDATAGFTDTVLKTAISEVSDVPPPSNVTLTRPISIVGRASAVDRILDFTGYAPEAQEEIRKTGRLGLYRGANIVKLTNWTDEDGDAFIPEDELYVMGGFIGKFVFYGGSRVKTWTEDKVDFTHFRSRRDLGGGIWHPEAMRRIKLAA